MGVLTDERTQHRYQTCRDEDCQRFACRIYREGYRQRLAAGHAAGYAEGEAAGYAEGRRDGYAAGAAAAGRVSGHERPTRPGRARRPGRAAGVLYLRPFGRCPKCKGTGHIKRGPRRRPVCPGARATAASSAAAPAPSTGPPARSATGAGPPPDTQQEDSDGTP